MLLIKLNYNLLQTFFFIFLSLLFLLLVFEFLVLILLILLCCKCLLHLLSLMPHVQEVHIILRVLIFTLQLLEPSDQAPHLLFSLGLRIIANFPQSHPLQQLSCLTVPQPPLEAPLHAFSYIRRYLEGERLRL